MSEIYLIYDRKYCCTYMATTDRSKAYEKVKELNTETKEHINRYKILTMKDFAAK